MPPPPPLVQGIFPPCLSCRTCKRSARCCLGVTPPRLPGQGVLLLPSTAGRELGVCVAAQGGAPPSSAPWLLARGECCLVRVSPSLPWIRAGRTRCRVGRYLPSSIPWLHAGVACCLVGVSPSSPWMSAGSVHYSLSPPPPSSISWLRAGERRGHPDQAAFSPSEQPGGRGGGGTP